MAQQVRLVDDIDQDSDADRTVTFALGKQEYQIDLTEENAEQLETELRWWISFARKAGAAPKNLTRKAAAPEDEDAGEWWLTPPGATPEEAARYQKMRVAIREWGRVHGWPSLGDRGRLPRALYAQYRHAHAGQLPVARHRDDPEPEPEVQPEVPAPEETETDNPQQLAIAHRPRRAATASKRRTA